MEKFLFGNITKKLQIPPDELYNYHELLCCDDMLYLLKKITAIRTGPSMLPEDAWNK